MLGTTMTHKVSVLECDCGKHGYRSTITQTHIVSGSLPSQFELLQPPLSTKFQSDSSNVPSLLKQRWVTTHKSGCIDGDICKRYGI